MKNDTILDIRFGFIQLDKNGSMFCAWRLGFLDALDILGVDWMHKFDWYMARFIVEKNTQTTRLWCDWITYVHTNV